MKELNMIEFNKILEEQSCALLCGNGFSCNFDDDFKTIFNRLYEAHKILIKNGILKTYSNESYKRKCLDNYKEVLKYVRYNSKQELETIFKDALIFAQSFIKNQHVVNSLERNEFLMRLTFGLSPLDLVKEICYAGEEYGIEYINIEYWTVLIYFYFAIKCLNIEQYSFPKCNSFIRLLELGNKNKTSFMQSEKLKDLAEESTMLNGFNFYYRLLFCIAIYSNRKAIDINKLDNLSKLNLNKIQQFLNKFNSILTLNYDLILEQLLPNKEIKHLHGQFVLNKKECVANQILGLNDGKDYISFSDILIGDYFYNKTYKESVNFLTKDNLVNKEVKTTIKIIEETIKKHNTNTFIIFGMGIQNDQHILRGMMIEFFNCGVKNPKIIYCYHSEKGKQAFSEEFYKVMTFSEELNNYAKNIEVQFVKTTDLIQEYFKS